MDYLKKYGIFQYEVSNFASQGLSRDNLQYWKSNSVAAFAPSRQVFLSRVTATRYRWKVGEMSNEYTIEKLDEKTLEFEKYT